MEGVLEGSFVRGFQISLKLHRHVTRTVALSLLLQLLAGACCFACCCWRRSKQGETQRSISGRTTHIPLLLCLVTATTLAPHPKPYQLPSPPPPHIPSTIRTPPYRRNPSVNYCPLPSPFRFCSLTFLLLPFPTFSPLTLAPAPLCCSPAWTLSVAPCK